MSATMLAVSSIEFFAGKQESFFADPAGSWRRVTPKEAAHAFTGRDRDSRDLKIGVFIAPLPGGMTKLGFDLWRLDKNLTESTRERLRALYVTRSSGWSKAERRRTRDRTHFSKSFAEFLVRREDVEAWKDELSRVLSDHASFEAI